MSNDETDKEIVGVLKIKRVGKSNTGMIVVNAGLMELLNQLNLGVGASLELVFDEKTKSVKAQIKKKSKDEKMEEYSERVKRGLSECQTK